MFCRRKLTTGNGGEEFVPDPTGDSVLRYGLVLSFCTEKVVGPFYVCVERTEGGSESRRAGGMGDGETIGKV
jgi:hypothetical protein